MPSQPWATSFTDTNTSTSCQNKVETTIMENGLKLPPLKPLSQIDCLAPCRADEQAIVKERETNMAKIRIRQKRIIKPEIKEREFGFGGRRKRHLPDFPDGSYPPLSQVPMGSSPVLETPAKKPPQVYKRNVINTTRLVPISQITCLIKKGDDDLFPRERKTPQENSASKLRGRDHGNDSTYVKLARSGGQKDLLHYIEAKPPLQRSVDSSYSPSPYGGTLPALKSKSVQDPSWKPSEWSVLSPIKTKEDVRSSVTPTRKKKQDDDNATE